MNIKKIQNFKFALMKKEKDVDASKADFIIYATAFFKVPPELIVDLSHGVLEGLVESIYMDLLKQQKNAHDSLGIWIEYDDNRYENAISLDTLNLIKKHGAEDVKPVYEFFKMTLPE